MTSVLLIRLAKVVLGLFIMLSCVVRYAQYGNISPKLDVYAFGFVLYELISAKEAIDKADGLIAESKGLVTLFEEVLSLPDPKEDLRKLVDPRLGDNYPLDSVWKMAQLAKACTRESSTEAKHEIYCGRADDSFVLDRRLRCWLLL